MRESTLIYHVEYKNFQWKKINPPKLLVRTGEDKLRWLKWIQNLNMWKDVSHGRDKLELYFEQWIINNEQLQYLSKKDNILNALKGNSNRIILDRVYEWELEEWMEWDVLINNMMLRKWKKYLLKLWIDYIFDNQVIIGVVILFKEDWLGVLKTIYVNNEWRNIVKRLDFNKYNNPESFDNNKVNQIL